MRGDEPAGSRQIRTDKDCSFDLIGDALNGYWIVLALFCGRVDTMNRLRQ